MAEWWWRFLATQNCTIVPYENFLLGGVAVSSCMSPSLSLDSYCQMLGPQPSSKHRPPHFSHEFLRIVMSCPLHVVRPCSHDPKRPLSPSSRASTMLISSDSEVPTSPSAPDYPPLKRSFAIHPGVSSVDTRFCNNHRSPLVG